MTKEEILKSANETMRNIIEISLLLILDINDINTLTTFAYDLLIMMGHEEEKRTKELLLSWRDKIIKLGKEVETMQARLQALGQNLAINQDIIEELSDVSS